MKSFQTITKAFLFLSAIGLSMMNLQAQGDQEQKDSSEVSAESKKDSSKTKSIADVIEKCQKYEGLFTMYQDTTNGKTYLLITKDQLGTEFLHFYHVENGSLNAGWLKGFYGSESLLKFDRYFDRIEITGVNFNYFFDPDNPLSKAADADINRPLIAVEKILAHSEKEDTFLISSDKLFLTEAFAQMKYLPSPESTAKNPFNIGNLSKEKTRFQKLKNYPENTDVLVNYVFENPYPTNFGQPTVTDPRYITIQVQHSLIALPENDFQSRYDDPRIGYFTTNVTDQISREVTPYRDLIHRWHLKKKDPSAALSEPVEPIVFWMENTTPVELRPLIKRGVEAWNIAFEQAGFKNAVVVKQQPDDADWDAGDLRYNVLRWTAAPMMGSAWGPSFVNPRTGQILGADIMLDWAFMRGMLTVDRLFGDDAKSLEEMMFDEDSQHDLHVHSRCEIMTHKKEQFQAAKLMARALGHNAEDLKRIEEEQIIELMLHEVGHTLGLNHNFRSSQLWDRSQINNIELTSREGLTGSVMDYNPYNLAPDPVKQGNFQSVVPGPYDRWAIEYGYSEAATDAMQEKERLNQILQRSTEKELTFGNDADAMFAPGRGIDPTINMWDMSNEVIQYGKDQVRLCRSIIGKLSEKFITEGNSYQELRDAYSILSGTSYRSLNVITRYIGGVHIDRAFIGQPGATQPYSPVPYAQQKEAMDALVRYGFSPQAFLVEPDLYAHLQPQRRGFAFFSSTEDPKIHAQINAYQRSFLSHLLHPSTLQRLTDTRLYGNTYSVSEMLGDLTDGIFQADLTTSVNTTRQNLQIMYLDALVGAMSDSRYSNLDKSAVFGQLDEILQMMKQSKIKETETVNHRKFIAYKIEKALDIEKKR
ncbi:MAG: zinc-dependent metalloprotease [Saprospiraceae bacterium]|nr:zinc-dependent metalloprotease [Saprospiraceae bacterium]